MKIKMVIADDLQMFREGLKMLLENEDQIEIVGEASNGVQLLYLVQEYQPDVVLTDIEMPELNGIEATLKMRERFPGVAVIGLTIFEDDYLIVDMLRAGARGYLLKTTDREELITGISAVFAGGYYFCNATSLRLSTLIAEARMKPYGAHQPGLFSEKELEIIELICEQLSSKEIAARVGLTLKTVENYRNKILEKMGARNMAGIVIYAMTNGLYRPKVRKG
jgi:DNA-binding NarL/FixJ family response regulator